MNNRDYKNFSKGSIYHLYNRGDNKETIFRDDQDYRAFLFRLGLGLGINQKDLNKSNLTHSFKSRVRIKSLNPKSFKLHAFCLMPNHLHLLVEQCSEESISKLLLRVFTSFSKYINIKYKRVGHVFQDQFKSVQIETNPQLMLLSSYIHMNPVKDYLVSNPEEYVWSSFNDYINNINNPLLSKDFLVGTFGSLDNFKKQNIELYQQEMSKAVFDTDIIDFI